jgi:16S rRNA (uracil1498-N3)-methyltransferase
MESPFFYILSAPAIDDLIALDEDTSKHVVQVLRRKIGDVILLTDGTGNLFTSIITDNHKKKCVVLIKQISQKKRPLRKISIAVSLLKNAGRFEWFLEKATEIGVTMIIPLICERTEKPHFRLDRMKSILTSAMLQSQQVWIPELKEPVAFESLISTIHDAQKFIAHCGEDPKFTLDQAINHEVDSRIILIGPEGDFTHHEIHLAKKHHFQPVTLGESRLRTETAAILAAVLLTR